MFWIAGIQKQTDVDHIVYEYYNYSPETNTIETLRFLAKDHDDFIQFYCKNKNL